MYSENSQHSNTTEKEVSPHCVDYSLSAYETEMWWSFCVRTEENGELTKIIQTRQSLS